MKLEVRDGRVERQVLAGMVVHRGLLAKVAGHWKPPMFASKHADVIGQWCVDYYKRYDKSPRDSVLGIAEVWSDRIGADRAAPVESLLSSVLDEVLSQPPSYEYLTDLAADYFNRVALRRTAENVIAELDVGRADDAAKQFNKFKPVEFGQGAGVDVLSDASAIEAAFAARSDPLIVYPGALGHFWGGELERDAFISIEAPAKRFKTFSLMDIAWMGMEQGRNVVFFEVGDLSQNQMMRRLIVRAAGRPWKATEPDKPVRYPTYLERDRPPTYDEQTFEDDLTPERAKKAMRRLADGFPGKLKLFTYPNKSVSVYGIEGVLKTLEGNGFVPDIAVVDYADLLAPPPGYTESRDQINDTWQRLRAISQSFHCLVVTGSQTKAEGFQAQGLDESHFSGDRRKRDHVTGTVGINQNDAEKRDGVYRLNWINRREDDFDRKKFLHVASCLPLARPCVLSTF